jgi:multidrug efflux pump
MLGVTLFGLFLTPVFYVGLRKWTTGRAVTEPLHDTGVGQRAS